ncbi:MAG: Swarming motility regulation sensor protein RssA [Betaproteobacteria bacterium ADurb.Bin341]|nr:MAG: Swarming motility regulation sensor protein RssA [Betaproteobacteria bacterium ADurb.Bin341]
MKFPSLSQYRLRLLFRGAFLFLALATVTLAITVLQEEKQLSYQNYQSSFIKTKEQIAARLRHPSGQLALLNPEINNERITPLRPLLLPFAGIDFDDQSKVRHAVEMAGCMVQYPDGSGLCAAIGSNPWAGGYIYLAGRFDSEPLVAHQRGDLSLKGAHRVKVKVLLRGQEYRWIAPFEALDMPVNRREGTPGRLTGFVDDGREIFDIRPVKDFRGWIWQHNYCTENGRNCTHRSFYSLRLPVEVLRSALFQGTRPQWPPADLDQIQVHLQILPPGDGKALFDSNNDGASLPFALSELKPLLLPGETLRIRKLSAPPGQFLFERVGESVSMEDSWLWLDRLIRRLPVQQVPEEALEAREIISTPVGKYEILLKGDPRGANKSLSQVATRVGWFVIAMLLAIALAWMVIEVGMIRRIALLTQRASSVSRSVRGAGDAGGLDLTGLRGSDELGILANCLHDLLQRVREDAERERIRAEQEKDMWHAVGHEIMSPLQSLMALHGEQDDQSARYIHRMQQAIRVLYGSASPSEAFQTTHLKLEPLEICQFLRHVAENAPCVGIEGVEFSGCAESVLVRADEYSLEDVVTHVLRNADRHRTPGSPIRIVLSSSETAAMISICNQGPQIPQEWMERIFEYGVSDQQDSGANGNRGQGLFVAKTYMAKMGGTIVAQNVEDGACFILTLQRMAD